MEVIYNSAINIPFQDSIDPLRDVHRAATAYIVCAVRLPNLEAVFLAVFLAPADSSLEQMYRALQL